jgi:hypothetical protein
VAYVSQELKKHQWVIQLPSACACTALQFVKLGVTGVIRFWRYASTWRWWIDEATVAKNTPRLNDWEDLAKGRSILTVY